MIDLHTHTVFSDGQLIPAELARRAEAKGLQAIALTDHLDMSMVELVVPPLVEAARRLTRQDGIKVIAGGEITHCPLDEIPELVERIRGLGASLVLVHGETLVEPVRKGTNRAAIEAGADILAHPGLISREDAALAARRGVCLEVSGRKGHSLTNGHVVSLAREVGAGLVFGSDAHAPEDLLEPLEVERLLLGAGLSPEEVRKAFWQARKLAGLE
jgi:histidinol phosphatase-like PHP family hydrolase